MEFAALFLLFCVSEPHIQLDFLQVWGSVESSRCSSTGINEVGGEGTRGDDALGAA